MTDDKADDELEALMAQAEKHPKLAWLTIMMRLNKAYENESDRAAALLAAAMLDFQFGEVLSGLMVDDKVVREELLESSRPLGTFSARINLLFALGYMPPYIHRAAHQVRKIRNEFAHQPSVLDFSSPPIAARCRSLFDDFEEAIPEDTKPPRARYLAAVSVCLIAVRFATVKFPRPVVPINFGFRIVLPTPGATS